ncbi:unnamed protein product, partial [Closterium sp. Naga37s-1]
ACLVLQAYRQPGVQYYYSSPLQHTPILKTPLASHWRRHEQGGECARFSLQLQKAPAVLDLPFPFLHDSVIQVEQGRHTVCSFLSSRHLHACGPYAALCGCASAPELVPATDQGQLAALSPSSPSAPSAARAAPAPPTSPSLSSRVHPTLPPSIPPPPSSPLAWSDYYLWRGLPLHSPAALLLHTGVR